MSAIKQCTIKFYTYNGSKDVDASVTVTVRDDNNLVAASVCDGLGHFAEHSNNGPFALTIQNPCKKADVQRGSMTIQFDPYGQTNWRFNFFLDVTFSNGSRLSGGEVGLVFDRNNKEQTFDLNRILI